MIKHASLRMIVDCGRGCLRIGITGKLDLMNFCFFFLIPFFRVDFKASVNHYPSISLAVHARFIDPVLLHLQLHYLSVLCLL